MLLTKNKEKTKTMEKTMLTSISIPEFPRLGQDLKNLTPPLSYGQRLEVLKFDRFCDMLFKQMQDHGAQEFSREILSAICLHEELWGEKLSILSLSFEEQSHGSLDDLEKRIQVFFEVPQVSEEALKNEDLYFRLVRRQILWTNVLEPDVLGWDGDQLSEGFLCHPETAIAVSLYREEYRDEESKVGLFILKP
jgi:hypothetical protein